MRIGSSIALIAVGLILAFAVDFQIKGLDLEVIGWILTLAGLAGLVISLVLIRRTRPVAPPAVVREEVYPPVYPPVDPRDRY